jgi:hypothetical protein
MMSITGPAIRRASTLPMEPAMDKQFFVSVEFLEHLQPS